MCNTVEELLYRPRVGHPGVAVTNAGGKKLGEAVGLWITISSDDLLHSFNSG
jgi:hypothetical protein